MKPRAERVAYRLSRAAEHDLLRLYRSGIEEFGLAQADDYFAGLEHALEFVADYPRAARERTEIKPPVRAHRYKSHMIVYVIEGADIVVLRIRHRREDWVDAS